MVLPLFLRLSLRYAPSHVVADSYWRAVRLSTDASPVMLRAEVLAIYLE